VPNKPRQENRPSVGRLSGRPPHAGGPGNNPTSGSDHAESAISARGTASAKGSAPADSAASGSNTKVRNTGSRRRERSSPGKGNSGGGKAGAEMEAKAGEDRMKPDHFPVSATVTLV
jgi:hypothetical protein